MAIKYTKSEDVALGYRVTGEGAQSIIYVPGVFSNLAMDRYDPIHLEWVSFLSQFGRLITFDKRGTGVSDRSARPLNLDQQVVDVEAIRDASGSEDLIMCGLSQGAPLAILYALAYPERVRALVLIEGVCCDATNPYASLSDTNTLFDWNRSLADMDSDFEMWCRDFSKRISPKSGPEDLDLEVEYMHATASPAAHRFVWACLMGFDIRPMLRHVQQPTLVIHAADDQLYPVSHGKYLAEHINGAEYLELESDVHVPQYDKNIVPQLFGGIKKFILGLPPRQAEDSSPRAITTVLFSDIVDSTEKLRTLGDKEWTSEIGKFESNAKTIVEQSRGKVVKFMGDGIMATFDVPGDGLRAARALVQDADLLGHPIRVGLHTGEVNWSEKDLYGLAVTIASRVASKAGSGEVLTTTVTQGIVEGGDFAFTEWGEAELKGVGIRRLVQLN